MTKAVLSQEELRAMVSYDPETGDFTWRTGRNPGAPATLHDKTNGYDRVKINGKLYRAHRLAWLYIFGHFPEKILDHINGNRRDNRICNLRDASIGENNQNSFVSNSGSTSAFRGVSWFKTRSKWRATININHKQIHLGYFDSQEDANSAYLKAKSELHPFAVRLSA